MIVGLVSSYRDGQLARCAVQSLRAACDHILVAEGPIGDAPESGLPSALEEFKRDDAIHVRFGRWDSDADKRTWLLEDTRQWSANSDEPIWGVWLDSDEVLIWGEHLPAWVARAELEPYDGDLLVSGGFPLRRVELDGSVQRCMGKMIRCDLIERYLHSIVEVKPFGLETSLALGDEPNWRPAIVARAGIRCPSCQWARLDVPTLEAKGGRVLCKHDHSWYEGDLIPAQPVTDYNRPPLQGEPHVLHLSALRDPARTAARQSDAEAAGYKARAAAMNIALPEWAT